MLHFLLKALEFGAAFWFGCGFIAFLRGMKYGCVENLRWIPLVPIGLLIQLLGSV